MKKQETGKKGLKWILLAAGLLVLAAAAAVLVLLLGRDTPADSTTEPTTVPKQEEAEPVETVTASDRLYWNVEKYRYSTREATRYQRNDGYYYVRFAVDGEQVDYPVADILLVNYIDTLEVMGLVFDRDGVIVDVMRVEEFAGAIVAEDYYVESVTEELLVCNSLGTMDGLSRSFELSESTVTYTVNENGDILCGMPGSAQEGGKVLVIADKAGAVTHIYAEDPFRIGDIYWNVTRKYDSTNKLSTRTVDVLGRYEYVFAINGEQVTLYTKDAKVANAIDAVAAKCMGLVFDEEGYITDVVTTKKVTGNSSFGSWYHVMEIDGSFVSATKFASGSDTGTSVRGKLAEDCRIYDVSGTGAYVGEPTELRLYDQIHGLKNPFGEIIMIFVVGRTYEADIYWNVSRQWNSTDQTTKRTPEADGYYYIKLARDGEQVTLRTQDITLVNAMDKIATKCFGLAVEGDVIQAVYTAGNVWGGRQFCSWDYVTAIEDGVVTAVEADAGKESTQYVGAMAADCGVYDVSGTGSFIGEETTLRVGDKIHALKTLDGKITYIFVVERSIRADIFWNVSRQWNSTDQVTKRTPNADGYYEIKLVRNGEQKTYRTKDKTLVNSIDSVATRCFGLEVSGDIITKFYKCSAVATGKQFCSWDYVTAISGRTVTAREADAAKGDLTYTGTMRADCGVYNVSGTGSFIGEETTLRVGDKIHALMDTNGDITYIFVVERSIQVDIFWNVSRQWNSTDQVTKRTPNADGYYEIKLVRNGEQKTYRTKDKALVDSIDSVATRCFGLEVSGDIITQFYKCSAVATGKQFCSWDDVTAISGRTVTAREADAAKGDLTYTGTMRADCGVYDVTGNGSFIGEETTLRVGDKIHALMDTDGNITYIFVVSRVEPVVEKTAHCDLCAKNVTWYSWDGSAAFEDGKHYYLAKNISVSSTAYIGSAADSAMEVTLDLSGKSITASVRAFRIYGTFNLMDSADGGTVYGNATGQATGFYVYDAGTFNLYGGTFVGSEAPNTQCGIGAVGVNAGSNAVFNMYGGCLRDGNTRLDGGNLALYRTSVFNMYGGQILNGQTAGNGGNISMSASAVINLYGGSIQGGQAAGNGSCVNATGTVNLYSEAAVTVTQLLLGSTPIRIDGTLPAQTDIGIALSAGSGVFTGETVEANRSAFHAAGTIDYVDGKLVLVKQPDKTALCPVCNETVEWHIWDGSFTLTEGHYYLTADITVSDVSRIEAGREVTLDLCGYDVTGAEKISDRLFRIYGTFNLTDSSETDGVISTPRTGGQAPVFYVYNDGLFNMYGGTIQGTGKVTSTAGGGLGALDGDNAVMNLYGGTVTGGQCAGDGGNIAMFKGCTLNVYGGTISDGASDTNGGNIDMTAASKLNLYGGTVTGGSAGNKGDCVCGVGTVSLYGDAAITAELYLPEGKRIRIGDVLASGSVIEVVLADGTGIFAEDTTADNQVFFRGIEEICYQDGCLSVGQFPEKETELAQCEHCQQEVEWTVWDGQTAFENGGHYCLDQSISISATAYIGTSTDSATTVCLDLRGYDITASVRAFRIYGTFNLMDSAETDGTVYGNATGQATGFYVYDAGTFNMYGGTFAGASKANSVSGIGALGLNSGSNAVFNMYGGCLKDGNTKADGANLSLYRSSTFNMYGGTISGGKTQTSGGSISMGETAVIHLYGGTIGMGDAAVNGDCINGTGTITLHAGDKITVAQIRLPSEKTLIIDGTLAADSQIGILLDAVTGVFTGSTVEANQAFFTDANGGSVLFGDGLLSVQAAGSGQEPQGHTAHCLCAGAGKLGDHTECADAQWVEWPGVESLTLDPDTYYYLTEDITLDGALDITAGSTLNLCLNGCDIEGADRVFQINGTLNLTDCAEEQGVVTSTAVRQAPVFYVRDGAVFNLYGGILQGTQEISSEGGVGALGLNADGGARMNMYGGTVTGGSTSNNGGNLVLYHDSILNIYGGAITAGSSASGGNILLSGKSAQVNLRGGEISDGEASGAGGNIRVSSGTLNIYSGTVSGGETTNGNGGSIFITSANSVMNMYGGTVTGGTANSGAQTRHGGNIYVAANGTLLIRDDPDIEGVPTVSNGTATSNNGGNIYYGGKYMELDGVSVTGGTAPGKGRDIYIATAGAVLKGNITCTDVYVNGVTVDTDELDPESEISITYA